MPRVFTIEVDGVPVAAVQCDGDAEARALLRQPWIRDDFASLSVDGVPLWRPGARLAAREASESEVAAFREGEEHTLEDDGLVLVYLPAIDDPRSSAR